MRRFKHQIIYISVFLFSLFLVSTFLRSRYSESFLDFSQFQRYFQQIRQKSQAESNYEAWLGYIYGNAQTSSEALNDFKQRAFQPTCLFRRDWDTNLPSGTSRPIPAQTKDLANMAYVNTLKCLASADSQCTFLLADFRKRFFEPGCNFRNPSNLNDYTANYQAVFK